MTDVNDNVPVFLGPTSISIKEVCLRLPNYFWICSGGNIKRLIRSPSSNHWPRFRHCIMWWRSLVVITTAEFDSTNPEVMFCGSSSLACNDLKICYGEGIWQWSLMELRLNTFCRSTISQKQSIIIINIIITIIIITSFFSAPTSKNKCKDLVQTH